MSRALSVSRSFLVLHCNQQKDHWQLWQLPYPAGSQAEVNNRIPTIFYMGCESFGVAAFGLFGNGATPS